MTFVFATVPLFGTRRRPATVSFDASEGLVKLEGRDADGNIKVWARNLPHQKFRQVGAMPRFDLADFFKRKMLHDDSERRCALREASHCIFKA